MEFRVLGPLEIVSDAGKSTPITRPLVRAAIFAMALHRNESLSPERLIDLLWDPDSSAGDRLHSLRSCMWTIRQLLPPERLVTDDIGYSLRIDPDHDRVDVDVFRRLHREGRVALSVGDSTSAARLLDEAIRLWRAGRLTDVLPDTIAMTSLITGLTEEYRDARNALIQARLALGQHRDLLPELRTLVTAEPANEQLWADLMLTLYRCGLKADALGVFTEARTALAAHADAEPGAVLQRLRHRIQAEDPALNLDPVLAPPARRGAAHHLPPRQLPSDVMDFTGRTTETTELIRLLTPVPGGTAVPVAEVIGLPGVGKTTLAVHAAHAVAHDYTDGQLFIRLAGATSRPQSPGAVLGEALRTLGVATGDIPATTQQRAAMYRSRLADQKLLVVLDDAASPEQVRPLLPGTAGCAVIVTSRAQLLGLAAGPSITLEPLVHGEALRLLRQIIGHPRVETEPDAADDVVAACGGLPLAVRIAGERLTARPTWPIAYLARALDDQRHRLDELVAGDLAVRASIALSYQALHPHAQRTFRLLALAGPYDAAGWVAGALLNEPAGKAIDTLIDQSLLTTTGFDATGQPRYRLHDLLREYATDLLTNDPEAEAARERLLRCWLELAEIADAALPPVPYFPPHPRSDPSTGLIDDAVKQRMAADPHAWFATERPTLVAAIIAACTAGAYQLGHELALRTVVYLHLRSHHDDAEQIWAAVTDAADAAHDETLASHARLRAAMVIAADRGHYARARPLIDRCITAFEASGDREGLARAYGLRAYCAQSGDGSQLHEACNDAEHGLDLARQITDVYTESFCLRILGLALGQLGDHERGIAYCEQALGIGYRLDKTAYVCIALYALIRVQLLAGQPSEAIELCKEGLTVTDQIDHELGRAYFHQQMGLAYQQLQKHPDAINALTTAIEKFRSRYDDLLAAYCLRILADSYQVTGNHNEAIRRLELSITVFHELGRVDQENEAQKTLTSYRNSLT